MQATRPRAIVDLIRSAEDFRIELGSEGQVPQPRKCERCGYICSQAVCKACLLLEGLNKGMPSMGISRPKQARTRAAAKSAADAVKGRHNSCACKGQGAPVNAVKRQSGISGEDGDQTEGHGGHPMTKQSNGCACNGTNQAEGLDSQPKAQTQTQTCTDFAEGTETGCCGNHACRGSDLAAAARLERIAAMPDTLDHLVQEDEDSQTATSKWAGGLHDSLEAALSSGQAGSTADQDLSMCSADDGLQHSVQAGLLIGSAPHSGTLVVQDPSMLSKLSGLDLKSEHPVRVLGKQYEANLREVNAHPSARHRRLRGDFDTSW